MDIHDESKGKHPCINRLQKCYHCSSSAPGYPAILLLGRNHPCCSCCWNTQWGDKFNRLANACTGIFQPEKLTDILAKQNYQFRTFVLLQTDLYVYWGDGPRQKFVLESKGRLNEMKHKNKDISPLYMKLKQQGSNVQDFLMPLFLFQSSHGMST